MKGYRNVLIIILALLSSTYLIGLGITYGTDMMGLGIVIGAKDAAAAGAVLARAVNKKAEALNGGVQ